MRTQQRAGRRRRPWAPLLDAVPAAFYVDRRDGDCVFVAPQIEDVVGCSAERWASGDAARLACVHPEDRDRVREGRRRLLESGVPQSDEFRVVPGRGGMRWVHHRAVPLEPGAPGRPALVHGVLVDVTRERKVGQHSGALFRALVEHAGEAVTIVDAQGVIVYTNASIGRVVGRSPRWLEGRSPLELMPPEDAEKGRQILMALHDHPGAQLPGEFRLKHRDGSWRIVAGVATNLLHDPDVRGIVLNYRDVTEEREAARAGRASMLRRQELLERVVQVEGEERARIAGELHDDTIQVMTASLLELDRIGRHLRRGDVARASEAAAKARQTLAEATERARQLTFELRPQQLDSSGLSAAIRHLADSLAAETGADVAVRTRLHRYTPAIETIAYRTIRELLINVRKHARATRVTIRVTSRRDVLHGEITDNGRGFRPARASAHATRHIGLATVRERLEMAGGRLDVASAVGEGTTVRFWIPLG